MHVVHVIARLNVGGTARYIQQVVQTTKQHGIKSTVLTGFVQGAEQEDPAAHELPIVRINRLGRAIDPRKDLAAAKEIGNAVSELKPDIVHTHTFKAGALTRIVNPDVPLVHTFHGHLLDDPEFQGPKKLAIIAAERALAPRAHKLITVGKQVAADLLARKIGTRDQYVSIPPGVTPLEQMDKADARRELGIDSHAVVVAWVARVTGVKAPQRMIDIAKHHPEITFVMAGGGDMEGFMRANAPENLKVLGWQPAVTVFSSADVVISTSENEGMPVALIEAQMMGLPVVATDVGSVAEVVENKSTGFVTSPKHLDTALTTLLADSGLRDQMGNAARARAHAEFGVERLGQRHADLYRHLKETAQ